MDAKRAFTSPRDAQAVDPVRIRGRLYSPDERNEVSHNEQLYRYQANRPCRAVYRGLIRAPPCIQIPIFPAAPWLMYDPSGIVCLLAALAFGPKLGAAVAILSWLPRVFLDPFGAPMGMLSTCCLIIPTAIIYAKSGNTRAGSIAGMVFGAALSIVAACALNLVVTPLYTAVTMEQVAGMILPILLPFNTLKMVINVVTGWRCWPPPRMSHPARHITRAFQPCASAGKRLPPQCPRLSVAAFAHR